MSKDVLCLIIGVVVALIAFVVITIIQIVRTPKEDKIKKIKEFVMSAIVIAENSFGSGKGAEKMAQVEKYFAETAPVYYKLILQILGKDSLKDIIEAALAEIKQGFLK